MLMPVTTVRIIIAPRLVPGMTMALPTSAFSISLVISAAFFFTASSNFPIGPVTTCSSVRWPFCSATL